MGPWLRNFFQSDEVPPSDILRSTYDAAVRVTSNPGKYPGADFSTLDRLIEEMESDEEVLMKLHY